MSWGIVDSIGGPLKEIIREKEYSDFMNYLDSLEQRERVP